MFERSSPEAAAAADLSPTYKPFGREAAKVTAAARRSPPPPLSLQHEVRGDSSWAKAVEVWRGSVATWECDAMGHLNVGFYVAKSMEGLAGLAAELGMPDAFAADARATLIVREQHIRFLREARPDAPLVMTGGVRGDRRERRARSCCCCAIATASSPPASRPWSPTPPPASAARSPGRRGCWRAPRR